MEVGVHPLVVGGVHRLEEGPPGGGRQVREEVRGAAWTGGKGSLQVG